MGLCVWDASRSSRTGRGGVPRVVLAGQERAVRHQSVLPSQRSTRAAVRADRESHPKGWHPAIFPCAAAICRGGRDEVIAPEERRGRSLGEICGPGQPAGAVDTIRKDGVPCITDATEVLTGPIGGPGGGDYLVSPCGDDSTRVVLQLGVDLGDGLGEAGLVPNEADGIGGGGHGKFLFVGFAGGGL